MKLSHQISSLLIRSTIGCALLGSAAFAAGSSNISQSTDYTYRARPNTTESFNNISAPNIDIVHVVDSGYFNVDAEKLKATGTVRIFAYTGDVSLSNVEGNYLQISTQNGTLSLSGDIKAEGDASTINVVNEGGLILNGANCENISVQRNNGGDISICGETKLSNVFFNATTVNVADGTNLTLDDVFFTSREGVEENMGASTALNLGDNVTLTLDEDSMVNVTELTVGSGLKLIITLSKETFAALDNTTFDIFSVQEGEVELTGANVSFTDGEQTKTGTITTEGGSITVTNSYVVPEPTTATLSLLALAALAARRRRK